MKYRSLLLLMFVCGLSFAQGINSYKYALVPARFSFQNSNDEYHLNTTVKMMMEKAGFSTFLTTDVMPDEMTDSNCNKVYVDVVSSGSFITTKLKIVLKDCKNRILYTSIEGSSKEKEYRITYNEALRGAAKSLETLHYNYSPKNIAAIAGGQKAEEKTVANETHDMKNEVLIAQPIANGFQLMDSSLKVIMKIFNTTNKNIFTATKGSNDGVFILKNNQWYFEFYQSEQLISEKIEVKF